MSAGQGARGAAGRAPAVVDGSAGAGDPGPAGTAGTAGAAGRTASSRAAGTTGRGRRLADVDALRAFALLGILVVNVWAFADPYYATASGNPAFDGPVDHTVRFVVAALFETKFYLLFSFLFGYSFTLQMASAERDGVSFVGRMLRRVLGLAVLGAVHGVALYSGEILVVYAGLALVLLVARNMTLRRAVVLGSALLAAVAVLWVGLGVLQLAAGYAAAPPGAGAGEALAKATAFGGDAGEAFAFTAGHRAEVVAAIVLLQGPSALAMFFFGFAAGRHELFTRALPRAVVRWSLGLGLTLGLAGGAFYAWTVVRAPGGGLETLAFGVGQLTAPFLTAAYVVGCLALFRRSRRVRDSIAPTGRMALTGYVGQSAVLAVVFTGYGLGLVDQVAPTVVLGLVAVVFAAQLVLSR
ncbi:DUF418 domain-containing protein [Oerskovia paurometabola]|uniref:DUF418 domain-containing protein n=1 Tax=Oerskovia paurometabola TaxID=162170 RepID=A0ABW1X5G2_9CELL|nr:DUF418 domain-containing protein [Oerskovia paurometabola]MBM7495832.1 uncharacterized protein [Oerskovia paurometabola]